MHTLIDVKFNPKEKKKLRKWSGSCRCGQWNGMAPSEKELNKLFSGDHKNFKGVR